MVMKFKKKSGDGAAQSTASPKKASVQQENGQRATTKQMKKGAPTQVHAEVLAGPPLGEHPAEVRVMYGLTIGLPRPFEFARIDVDVKLPCSPSNLEATYDKAREFAITKLQEEVRSIRESELGGGASDE